MSDKTTTTVEQDLKEMREAALSLQADILSGEQPEGWFDRELQLGVVGSWLDLINSLRIYGQRIADLEAENARLKGGTNQP